MVDDELIRSEKDVCGGRGESLITAGFLGGLEGLVGAGMSAETAVGIVLSVSRVGNKTGVPFKVRGRGEGASCFIDRAIGRFAMIGE